MSRATAQMRNLAKRLMADEARGNYHGATKTPADFNAWEPLRLNLATFMGNAGYRALLSRALALAKAEVPWLGALHVNAAGALEGVEEHLAQLDPEEWFEGRVVLLAQVLGLLVAFIGENLTFRLVREAWPKARFSDAEFGNGGGRVKNEER